MDGDYLAYLELLGELTGSLDQLSELARQKTSAVSRDNLLALDEVLKQEQAMSLALRGQEQRRMKLIDKLGLANVPLTGLAERCPAQLQVQARQTVEDLQRSYAVYRSAAEVARNTLECNLHELEKVIAQLGGDPAETGAGYDPPSAEPPKNMKTDFRA